MSSEPSSISPNNNNKKQSKPSPRSRLLSRIGVFFARLVCMQVEKALPPEAVQVGMTAEEVEFLTHGLSEIFGDSPPKTPSNSSPTFTADEDVSQ